MSILLKNSVSLFALSSSAVFAASQDRCEPAPPAICYEDSCSPCHCLGPDNILVNAPVCPKTCGGDFQIGVAGLYWIPHQDGMEYGIQNQNRGPLLGDLSTLIDSTYLTPGSSWDFGFKLDLGYCFPCDGWDLRATWTWYKGHGSSHDETELNPNDEGARLIPLWMAYTSPFQPANIVTDIQTYWKLQLNWSILIWEESFG